MKKLFLIATVALGLGAMTSCNSKCKVEADPQADTLAACMGEMYGFGVAGQMQNMNDSTFDKKEFLAGLQMMLKMDESKSSYVQGVQMGAQVKGMFEQLKERENVDINAKRWLASFKKAFMSDSLQDPSKYQIEVMRLVRELSNKVKAQDPKAIANKNNAEKFIADSLANNPDVKKSEGGVYYKVVKEGKGEKFTATDRINVKYTGRHLDGTEFDSSKGESIVMASRGVIKGMGEMFQLMSPGAVYTLYIPAELAYGLAGSGPIGPNEMLIFDVETVGLADAKK
jgi:FKBP-type peptidyl-prolyl cis-trans isomerase